MSIDRPIVILATPRSGSSMTTRIFHAHGVWMGPDTENPIIKAEQIRRWGRLTHVRSLATCQPQDGFKDFVERAIVEQGYEHGPWLYKQSALYSNAWAEWFPQPTFIGIHRTNNVDAIRARPAMVGGGTREDVERLVARHEEIIQRADAIVHTDEVVAGNFASLADAFEVAGLKFDARIASQTINPAKWHY